MHFQTTWKDRLLQLRLPETMALIFLRMMQTVTNIETSLLMTRMTTFLAAAMVMTRRLYRCTTTEEEADDHAYCVL